MGRYTEKTTVTRAEHALLTGLLAIARDHNAHLETIGRQVAVVIGEKPVNGEGHAFDAVYGNYTVDDLLSKSEITLIDAPEVSPTCEVVNLFGCDGDPVECCGDETAAWYPAAGGGTMALCYSHAVPHGKNVVWLPRTESAHG